MSNNHTHVVDLNKAKARELEQSAIQNARVNPETPVKSVLLNLAIVAWIKLLLWFESCVKKVNTIKNYTQCIVLFGLIHFIFGCSPCGKAVPAGYVLLPDRNQTTYEKLISSLKSLVKDVSHVKYVSVDFEVAVHNVLRSLLPDVIFGSIFYTYMRQAIHRQITLFEIIV